MLTLAIDIETFSSTDLKTSGVYKYTESPDFTILLFAYSVDDSEIKIVDLASGESLPVPIRLALTDARILKTAHNANFERTCISKHLNTFLPPQQWSCTMAKASMLGLPLSLDAASKALKLAQEKSSTGKTLIRYFSIPCKPTKVNGGRTRNLPEHDPVKWDQFKQYCINDVVVEKSIRNRIEFFDIPETEIQLWNLDQKINDQGILIDLPFVKNAIQLDRINNDKLNTEAIELTSLENPNSTAQLKSWLTSETGSDVISLTKDSIPVLLENSNSDNVTRVLNIRQEMAKTSIKKYLAMVAGSCQDNRLRGIHQYYGANRTGRWAGRLVQPQNLPKNSLFDLDLARNLVREGDLEMLEILFGNVPDTLSQLIRTAFVAKESHRFIVADFSAIEARVIAWLANEKWRLDVFNTHGKIYEASAAHMFKVPLETVTKGSHLRQKGKMSELALGYQGGPNAIIRIEISNKTPKEQRIPEEELPQLVAMWRNANKRICLLWKTVEEAALTAVIEGRPVQIMYGIKFFVERNILFIQLPSKRRLAYIRPKIMPQGSVFYKAGERFTRMSDTLTYEGMDQNTKQWGIQDTYGGKLVENIVQAIARDCLADAMIRIDAAGYNIVLHVHDEIVPEAPYGFGSCEEINKIMSEPISWAPGLPLAADSYETEYYRKD